MAVATGLPGTTGTELAYVELKGMDKTRTSRVSGGGPAGLVLGLALLVPLGVALMALMQLPGTSLASPSSLMLSGIDTAFVAKRPAASNPAPPPTLAAPTATPRPTVTPVPPTPLVKATATPQKGGTYTVKSGDELKHIAADYNVSIWKIIAANDIPNPDSLRIGQELKIPDN
jgi:LysM repeat protein